MTNHSDRYDEVYIESRFGQLMLVKRAGINKRLIVELKPGNGGDFYSVISGNECITVKDELLWSAAHSRPVDLGGQPALSETATLAKSDESRSRTGQTAAQTSIGQSGENINTILDASPL